MGGKKSENLVQILQYQKWGCYTVIPTRHGQDLHGGELLSREVAALAFEAATSRSRGGYELGAAVTFALMSAGVLGFALVLATSLLVVLLIGVVLGGV